MNKGLFGEGHWEMSPGHREEAEAALGRLMDADLANGLIVIGEARQGLIVLLVYHDKGDSMLVFNPDEARFVVDQIERAIEAIEGRKSGGDVG